MAAKPTVPQPTQTAHGHALPVTPQAVQLLVHRVPVPDIALPMHCLKQQLQLQPPPPYSRTINISSPSCGTWAFFFDRVISALPVNIRDHLPALRMFL